MCGICQEETAIKMAQAITLREPLDEKCLSRANRDGFYFQECENICDAILKRKIKLGKLLENNSKDEWSEYNNNLPLQVIFCRLMELLTLKGFQSIEYQKLISEPLIIDIIKRQTEQVIPPDCEGLFNHIPILKLVISESVFLDQKRWNEICYHTDLQKHCLDFLEIYLNWRKSHKNTGYFHIIFPYAYFSFLIISQSEPEHEVIKQLVQKQSPFGLLPGALELWFQRKATLTVFNTSGLSTFLPHLKTIRPLLLYYLVVKNKLNKKEKCELRKELIKSGAGNYDPEMYELMKRGPMSHYANEILFENL